MNHKGRHNQSQRIDERKCPRISTVDCSLDHTAEALTVMVVALLLVYCGLWAWYMIQVAPCTLTKTAKKSGRMLLRRSLCHKGCIWKTSWRSLRLQQSHLVRHSVNKDVLHSSGQ